MTTRRNILKGGAGIAAILASGKAPAYLVKSMLASRGSFLGRGAGGGWVNPYVTDGLVAMWDGEWNAGGGVHDANATVWRDIISGNTQTIYDRGTSSHWWENNYLVCSNHPEEQSSTWDNSYTGGMYGSLAHYMSGDKTVEIVCDITYFPDSYMGRNMFFGSNMIWNNGNYYWVIGSQLNLGTIIRDVPFVSSFVIGENLSYYYYRNGTQLLSATLNADPFLGKTEIDTLNLLYATYSVSRIRKTYAVRIYSRVLTAAEIAANCAVDKARLNRA